MHDATFSDRPLGNGPDGYARRIRDQIRPRKYVAQNRVPQPGTANHVDPGRMVKLAEFVQTSDDKGEYCPLPGSLDRKEQAERDKDE